MGLHEDRTWARREVVPVDRRRFGLDRASIGPALLVLALALVMAVGVGIVNSAIPADDEVRPGDVLQLANGVTFVPAAGWTIAAGVRAGDGGNAGNYPSSTEVTNGSVSLALQTAPWPDDATALLEQVRRASDQARSGPRVEGEVATFRTAAGAAGVAARYRSATTDGLVGALVLDGTDGPVGVEVTATGPLVAPGSAAAGSLAPEVVTMIESITVVDGSAG